MKALRFVSRVLIALQPWLWIVLGVLYAVMVPQRFVAGDRFMLAIPVAMSIACVLLGLAEMASRRAKREVEE